MQVEDHHGESRAPGAPRRTAAAPSRTAATPTLLGAQLLFNIGFYGVVPFLALVLTDDFALAGTAVGVILGVRTFAQQGLFLVGGTLTDRFGARGVIVVGCGVRTAGFLTLAASLESAPPSLPLFVAGTVLTGLGGALFSPALNTLVAAADLRTTTRDRRRPASSADATSRSPRATLFAWLTVTGEVGAAIGPLLGAALLGWGFATVAASGAALFAAIGAILWHLLPGADRPTTPPAIHSPPPEPHDSAATSPPPEPCNSATTSVAPQPGGSATTSARTSGLVVTRTATPHRRLWASLHDRRFVRFAALHAVDLVAYNQLYLSLPLALGRADEGAALVGWLFAWVSVLTLTLQLPLARGCARLGPGRSLRIGYALSASAFATLALAAILSPEEWPAWLPMLAASLMITGHLIAQPTALSTVPAFAAGRPTGSFFGLLSTMGGVAVLLGNLVVGSLLDAGAAWPLGAALPWVALALLPLISAIGIGRVIPATTHSTTAH
ncbi:MAG: MFS transporter [Propioniciclava sp.]|uniref:MFS transporter n=1 Tax=Propioniciclava sp. TaxID=2038686 RepID=UPI0039E4E9B9